MDTWRINNKERYRELQRNYCHRQFIKLRGIVDDLKSNPCTDCGGVFATRAMDFDHRPDTVKSFCIGEVLHQGKSVAMILREIEKCDLVCANCHRTRTRSRRIREGLTKTTRARHRLTDWVESLKKTPCVICTVQCAPHQMDFDHIPPHQKAESICDMVSKRRSKEKIVAELEKCRLVCANCHRVQMNSQPEKHN